VDETRGQPHVEPGLPLGNSEPEPSEPRETSPDPRWGAVVKTVVKAGAALIGGLLACVPLAALGWGLVILLYLGGGEGIVPGAMWLSWGLVVLLPVMLLWRTQGRYRRWFAGGVASGGVVLLVAMVSLLAM
jgi:hypothetical protein